MAAKDQYTGAKEKEKEKKGGLALPATPAENPATPDLSKLLTLHVPGSILDWRPSYGRPNTIIITLRLDLPE